MRVAVSDPEGRSIKKDILPYDSISEYKAEEDISLSTGSVREIAVSDHFSQQNYDVVKLTEATFQKKRVGPHIGRADKSTVSTLNSDEEFEIVRHFIWSLYNHSLEHLNRAGIPDLLVYKLSELGHSLQESQRFTMAYNGEHTRRSAKPPKEITYSELMDDIFFVEVKGPTTALSKTQQEWIGNQEKLPVKVIRFSDSEEDTE